jgi:hypothetical protein
MSKRRINFPAKAVLEPSLTHGDKNFRITTSENASYRRQQYLWSMQVRKVSKRPTMTLTLCGRKHDKGRENGGQFIYIVPRLQS